MGIQGKDRGVTKYVPFQNEKVRVSKWKGGSGLNTVFFYFTVERGKSDFQ